MGKKEWDPETIFDVIGDSLSRRILVAAANDDISAEDLADRTDVSLPTVYRRLTALTRFRLLSENEAIDPQGQNHKIYRTAVSVLGIEIREDGLEVSIRPRESLTDQFEPSGRNSKNRAVS